MNLQELLLEELIVFLQCDLNVVCVCGGGDFVRMRERFDDSGQTLEVWDFLFLAMFMVNVNDNSINRILWNFFAYHR